MKAYIRDRQKYIQGDWYGEKKHGRSAWRMRALQCVDYEYLAFISVQLGQVACSEQLKLYHQTEHSLM
jgi:hypothetical protein